MYQAEIVQQIVMPTYKRQILLVQDNATLSETNFAVHKFHHPIVILEAKKNLILQKVFCKNSNQIIANVYDNVWNHWTLPFTVDSMSLER